MSAARPLPSAITTGTAGFLDTDSRTVWIVFGPPSRTSSTTGIPWLDSVNTKDKVDNEYDNGSMMMLMMLMIMMMMMMMMMLMLMILMMILMMIMMLMVFTMMLLLLIGSYSFYIYIAKKKLFKFLPEEIFRKEIAFSNAARNAISTPYFPVVPLSTSTKCVWLLSRHAPDDDILDVIWYVTVS